MNFPVYFDIFFYRTLPSKFIKNYAKITFKEIHFNPLMLSVSKWPDTL